ncbi:MAG TPA: PH domain-containing protein [bacterium]|jgi:uncharacterized membrane protein YdbT with pleckstrin-like domain|nr:MAG: Bacterial membrane flanked domain protein [Bacteroidetes bacterium ADurb.Bin028]HOG38277.1 PH domain-containing protein [bacterium]
MKMRVKPSQWANILWFILAIIGAGQFSYTGQYFYLLLVIWWLWKFAVIECWVFIFDENSETIVERKGVFYVRKVEIQYFRIKSIRVMKPLWQRIFGLSTVQIITSEPFKPFLTVYAISNGEEIARHCKEMAVYWRQQKGVKETDFHHF